MQKILKIQQALPVLVLKTVNLLRNNYDFIPKVVYGKDIFFLVMLSSGMDIFK